MSFWWTSSFLWIAFWNRRKPGYIFSQRGAWMLPQLGLLRAVLCRVPSWLGQAVLTVHGKSNSIWDCIISPWGLRRIWKGGRMMNLMSFLSPWVSLAGHVTWSISLQLQSSSHCCGCNGNSFLCCRSSSTPLYIYLQEEGGRLTSFPCQAITLNSLDWNLNSGCGWILAGWFLWKACMSHFNFSSFKKKIPLDSSFFSHLK